MKVRITNADTVLEAMRQFAKQSQLEPGLIATRVAFKAFGGERSGVVGRTPVATGWARNSWNIAQGSVDLSVPSKPPKGTVAPAPVAAPPAVTPDFPTWYVTNNLDYIIELENGHSKQMDKGYMVQRTLVEVEDELRKELGR